MEFNFKNKRENYFINLSQLEFLGGYSADKDRKFHHDNRKLRFLIDLDKMKNVAYKNLNDDIETVHDRDYDFREKEGLDMILLWVILNKQKLKEVDFVCYREVLTLLMCTPYERKKSWIIHAIRFNDTIYLRKIETPLQKMRRKKNKRVICWGYNFERHMTCKDKNEPVYEAEEYSAAFKAKLGEHSLLYAAEIDCADKTLYKSAEFDNTKSFVELKCVETQNDFVSFFRGPLKKWWAQSYLGGTKRILCGFRNSKGIVQKLNWHQVEDIPKMTSDYWRKSVMLTFTNDILEWIKKTVVQESKTWKESVVYKFESKPRERKVTCSVFPAEMGMGFIRDYYFNENLYLNNVFKS